MLLFPEVVNVGADGNFGRFQPSRALLVNQLEYFARAVLEVSEELGVAVQVATQAGCRPFSGGLEQKSHLSTFFVTGLM